jgi:TRAP-type C4-dicarboxylate transport system permease small subunit
MNKNQETPAPVPVVLKPLRLADTLLRHVEMSVLIIVLLTMIGLSFAQVVLRTLQHAGLGQPVSWFEDLDRHFVLWVGMLGASIAAREGRHFGVEALPKLFSETGRRRLEGALNFVAAVICALLTYIMWTDIVLDEIPRSREHHLFVLEAIRVVNEDGHGTHGLPVEKWWLLSIIPFGLVGMTFRFFLRSLEATLLTNEQWHWLERELKPDVVAAAQPDAHPAGLGSGAVVATATPPATQRFQEVEARAASERLAKRGSGPNASPNASATAPPAARAVVCPQCSAPIPPAAAGRIACSSCGATIDVPAPPAQTPAPKKAPTGEIKAFRLGDQSDVVDPDARPGPTPPPDEEESLVDSDVLMRERSDEESTGASPTDRQTKQPGENGGPAAGGKSP